MLSAAWWPLSLPSVSFYMTSVARTLELERRLSAIFETAAEGIVLIDKGGRIELFSPSAERTFGYQAREVIGQNVSILIPAPDCERHDAYIDNYLRTGVARVIGVGREVTGLRKDGTRFPLYLSVGEVTRGEKFVGIVRDLTEAKEAERARRDLQDKLAHVGRIGAMGEIATNIAHEVNQPLTAIASYAQACRRMLDMQSDPRELAVIVDKIAEQALRGGMIIQRLREFIRGRSSTAELADINDVVRQVSELCRIEASRRGATIILRLAPRLPPVSIDRVQIQQVVFNLTSNAIEAMDQANQQDCEVEIATHLDAGGDVVVVVSDTGPGMSDETAQRLFEPFYTTRDTGMGMGLPICLTIVEAHGGKLRVSRDRPAGLAFSFNLPVRARGNGNE
jgi:two-component system sensor kinase FixL